MRLIEHDGKSLLAAHGIEVPQRRLLAPDAPLQNLDWNGPAVLKAQVFSGGRGKAGLVRRCDHADLGDAITTLRTTLRERGLPAWVMLETPLDIAAEFYLAIVVDDVACAPCLLFSVAGGVAVEEQPEAMRRLPLDMRRGPVNWQVIDFLRAAGLDAELLGPMARSVQALWRVWSAEEAEQVEINPLALTRAGKLVPADAKVTLDDQAGARHPQRAALASVRIAQAAEGPRKASGTDTYVEMPGNIGMLTGGAGLGMATLDMLADAGLRAATFVDGAGGGGDAMYEKKALLVLERSRDPAIEGVLIYFTLAAASLAPIARGTVKALREFPLDKPVVVGIVAAAAAEAEMSAAEARELFIAAGYPFHAELDEAIAELARRVALARAATAG